MPVSDKALIILTNQKAVEDVIWQLSYQHGTLRIYKVAFHRQWGKNCNGSWQWPLQAGISPSTAQVGLFINVFFKTFSMITLSLKKEKLSTSNSPCTWTLHLPSPKTWTKFVTPLSGLYPNKTIMSFPTTVAVCPVTPTGLSTGFFKRVHCLNVMLNVHVSLETTPFLQVPPKRIKQFWNKWYTLKLTARNILNCYKLTTEFLHTFSWLFPALYV